MKKKEYTVSHNGMDFHTDNLWHAIQALAWVVLIMVLGILSTRTFWICAAILAAAFIMRGC